MELPLADSFRKTLTLANQEAQRFNHEYIGTEHILLGLAGLTDELSGTVLYQHGLSLRHVRLEVEKLVKSGPDMVTMGRLPLTPRAKKVCEYAKEEAKELGHSRVTDMHLLLGCARERDGVAAAVLESVGFDLKIARRLVSDLLQTTPVVTDEKCCEGKDPSCESTCGFGLPLAGAIKYQNPATLEAFAKSINLKEQDAITKTQLKMTLRANLALLTHEELLELILLQFENLSLRDAEQVSKIGCEDVAHILRERAALRTRGDC
jgi:ATP-dependent Clp protease ATP-binding subunit ClpA